jgi:hypothetical protein
VHGLLRSIDFVHRDTEVVSARAQHIEHKFVQSRA